MSVAQTIRGKYPNLKIIICGDNDMNTEGNPGVTKATEAAKSIKAHLAIPKFKDSSGEASDFNDLATIEGKGVARQQVDSAAIVQAEHQKGTRKALVVVSLVEFLQQEHPPRVNILSPWMPEQGLCMLHAWRGVGKTHVSCGVACAVAAGDKFLKWEAPEPVGVLLIDGEMPARVLQERLQRIILGMEKQPEATLKIITPDNQLDGMPDLGTEEGQLLVEEHITEDIKLIIVDNLSTLVRTGRENDADGWLPVQGWFLKLRAAGKSVLAIHHSNKSGKSRGTSKREDALDTVICLEHPKGYTPEQGACFEVHFEKNRGIYGDDVKPFEAKLTNGENEESIWTTRTLEDSTYDKVVRLANEGLNKSEIATELDIHKSTAGRHYNNGTSKGDITP
jgi:putative DNA primase/helicase